jgi:hypothetical protein
MARSISLAIAAASLSQACGSLAASVLPVTMMVTRCSVERTSTSACALAAPFSEGGRAASVHGSRSWPRCQGRG